MGLVDASADIVVCVSVVGRAVCKVAAVCCVVIDAII